MPKRGGLISLCLVALAAHFSGRRQGLADGELRGFSRASAIFVSGALRGRHGGGGE